MAVLSVFESEHRRYTIHLKVNYALLKSKYLGAFDRRIDGSNKLLHSSLEKQLPISISFSSWTTKCSDLCTSEAFLGVLMIAYNHLLNYPFREASDSKAAED